MRIWNGFGEPDSSGPEPSDSADGSVGYRLANHARGIRLLVEEMQQDTKVSAQLRADLAASLRSEAAALAQRSASASERDGASEQQLVRECDYRSLRRWSHSARTKQAVDHLTAKRSDPSVRLRETETFLLELQLSHLRAALAVSVQTSARPSRCDAVVRSLIQVADSLGETARILRSAREQARLPTTAGSGVDGFREFSQRLSEATHEWSRTTAELRNSLGCLVEDPSTAEPHKSTRDLYSSFGGMLDLAPRLQQSRFDPTPEGAFRSVRELLSRPLLTVSEPDEDRGALSIGSEMAISK